MIKRLIKILSITLIFFFSIILYLSFIGIKTEKFNERISSKVLKINNKINIDLKDIKFLLYPFNFTVNISTKEPTIGLGGNKLRIKDIKTNISLRSLIFNQFLIDDLQISTKPITLKDLVLLGRSFKNSTELFLLDKIIKDGFLIADIKLKFDNKGNLQEDYQINGFIKNTKLNFLNQLNIDNLNLNFDIIKNKYSLTEINGEINNVELSSPLIEINEKKDLFFIKGKVLTKEKDYNKDQLSIIFVNLLKNSIIEEARFSSENNISLNVSKKLKFNDLNIESKINLDQLVIKNNFKDLKLYLPSVEGIIKLEKHKIVINYNKDNLKIKGKGETLIKNKSDFVKYNITKKNNKFIFDTEIKLKNNKLLIDGLSYEKKENLDASILIKGNFKKSGKIKFDLISLIEKDNKILFKNVNLSKKFKIISIDSFNFDYLNTKKIKNQLSLKKNNSNYNIEGESFDATNLINQMMNNESDDSSLFSNLNSKINLKIYKTYIDEVNFINNLSGMLDFKNSKINDLNLKSNFPNNKEISLSIKTNNQQEKITNFSTNYPEPLIKRYDFIKGFEEGFLNYYSIKKNGVSKSLLIIDDFKIKEVPVFAKLLSLASLQGVADLLTGEGIRFTDFEMKFSNKKSVTTIEEMYAIGPAVSILMDGYIDAEKLVSLRGTLVPATTINRTIASIPLLGKILVGDKTGEGVFGVSFKIKGLSNNLKTSVNPIKTLTPRFITRTLEKIKKN